MSFVVSVRELLKARSGLKIVIVILSIGFLGPLFTFSLQSSVNDYVDARAKQLLSADLAFTKSTEFTDQETDTIDRATRAVKVTEATEFVTMGQGHGVTTLVEVEAVDPTYPVLGDFKFDDGRRASAAGALSEGDVAWVFPEVLAQLGLQKGDTLTIGRLGVTITEVLKEAPGTARAGVFAPRLFIGKSRLLRTGLNELGSQAQYRRYVRLPAKEPVELAAASAKATLANPEITIRTPDDATASLERFFSFFKLYLAGLSVVLFSLSWVSAFYLLQSVLETRLKTSAILLTFGATRSRILLQTCLQILIVMSLSLVAASAGLGLALKFGSSVFASSLPEDFSLRLNLIDVAKLFAIALVSALAFAVPSALRLRVTPLTDLLSGVSLERLTLKQMGLAYLPLTLVFFALSVSLMGSLANTFFLILGLGLALGLAAYLARLIFRLSFRAVQSRAGFQRLVATQLVRARFGTLLCLISLFMSALVLNLVPHLFRSALKEIEPLHGRALPALFLFNIPESNFEAVQKLANQQHAELKFTAPMILARIQKVNGEAPANEMFQKYPVRLTYRSHLIDGETLVKGVLPKDPVQSGAAVAVSIEQGFAERTGLKLGDQLEFEVQGLPIAAQITSLRKVRWTDFNPNFFMVLQTGAIDDAPKSYLASLYAADDSFNKEKTENVFVREAPDVSLVDVGRTLEKVVEVARSLLQPVRVAAGVAVLISLIILAGVMVHHLGLRQHELDIQKLLGADASLIRWLVVGEYAALAGVASVLGALFAIAVTKLVTNFIFEIAMSLDLGALLGSLALINLIAAVISFWAAGRALRRRGSLAKL